jgi:hypothetical protein
MVNTMFTRNGHDGRMRPPAPLCLFRLALPAMLCVVGAPAASAQCLLCSDSSASSTGEAGSRTADDALPLRIEITANLDFARIAGGRSGGQVALDPSGRGSVRGDVAPIGGAGFSGRVLITGTPGRAIRVTMPSDALLTASSGRVARLHSIVAGIPPIARLGPDGRLEFGFGGVLDIGSDATGDYSGRIPITVAYE